jgi:hypothetical protein
MRPLARDEIVGIDAYEALRDAYRKRVMELKQRRRLGVGERATLVFENRETIRFQVQEMIRVERLRRPEQVQRELDVYNELVPGDGEISATLLIEITEPDRIRAELDRLLGIDEQVFLVFGDGPGAARIRARFDERQMQEDRISAVHYLRFAAPADAAARLRDLAQSVRIAIEHPAYRHAEALPPALRASLAADLEGEPAPLLVAPPGADAEGTPAGGRVRVRRAERPAGRGHVVVEPAAEAPGPFAPDAALEAELLAAVKEQARAVLRRHGACRVLCDLHEARLRWHVFAPEP